MAQNKDLKIYLLLIQTREDYYHTDKKISTVLSATSLEGLAKSFERYCQENRDKETDLDDEDIEESVTLAKENILKGKEYDPELEIAYITSLSTSKLNYGIY